MVDTTQQKCPRAGSGIMGNDLSDSATTVLIYCNKDKHNKMIMDVEFHEFVTSALWRTGPDHVTVSRSVSLGVEPHLGLMTRCLVLFDSYCFVSRAPSLTRGWVCHLS
jgi:hypothetical protein